MDERKLRNELEADLQRGRVVLYLEGPTDVDALFALLGVPQPSSSTYRDIYVCRGGSGGGSGVAARVELAQRLGYSRVFGVIDGDGGSWSELSASFDEPFRGPLFSWKAYAIENLLVQAGWPSAWGPVPDWRQVLARYAPYAALNRLHVRLRDSLRTLDLHRFTRPGATLLSEQEIEKRLQADKHRISGLDVQAEFKAELALVRGAIDGSLPEAHALVDGKWLIEHFAPLHTGRNPGQCRAEWCEAVRARGGDAEVCDLWPRLLK